jgi:hypothetical protein
MIHSSFAIVSIPIQIQQKVAIAIYQENTDSNKREVALAVIVVTK